MDSLAVPIFCFEELLKLLIFMLMESVIWLFNERVLGKNVVNMGFDKKYNTGSRIIYVFLFLEDKDILSITL